MDDLSFEFRGMIFRPSLSAAPHFYSDAYRAGRDGRRFISRVRIMVPCSGPTWEPDIEGPIILDAVHWDIEPITAEEDDFLRPLIRGLPALKDRARRGWAEAAARAEAERPFAVAAAERERVLGRMGLADTAGACEAERTPLRIPAGREAECLECGATYPPEKAHLVDAGGMGCVGCNH